MPGRLVPRHQSHRCESSGRKPLYGAHSHQCSTRSSAATNTDGSVRATAAKVCTSGTSRRLSSNFAASHTAATEYIRSAAAVAVEPWRWPCAGGRTETSSRTMPQIRFQIWRARRAVVPSDIHSARHSRTMHSLGAPESSGGVEGAKKGMRG
ncbi:hypothetical protein Vretimale_983 [Volvox reticuliferus]|uniref:Uncharacterized protein n=1 Tax=Volvox reticuliferus TaxID=1737510 RepID=A0A8J4CKC5_9CHLO|nr:hypothetical protein Vretifemale_10511 [Volvox reticuliferus]GIL94905.1 hypothetical protein Vretimale_983 [Volvox reticuliferus]